MDPLRAPVLVAAFEGWNDAGDAAGSYFGRGPYGGIAGAVETPSFEA